MEPGFIKTRQIDSEILASVVGQGAHGAHCNHPLLNCPLMFSVYFLTSLPLFCLKRFMCARPESPSLSNGLIRRKYALMDRHSEGKNL